MILQLVFSRSIVVLNLFFHSFLRTRSLSTTGLDKFGQTLKSPRPGVLDRLVVPFTVQLDGRIADDLGVLQLVNSRIDLGDDDIFIFLEVLADLLVDRHQLFAVATPWSIELNQHVLGGVEDDAVEVASHQGLDRGGVPVVGKVLAEQVLLQLTVQVVLHEATDVLGGQFVGGWLVLGDVLVEPYQTCSWNLQIATTFKICY